jgi:hypothetical protein
VPRETRQRGERVKGHWKIELCVIYNWESVPRETKESRGECLSERVGGTDC